MSHVCKKGVFMPKFQLEEFDFTLIQDYILYSKEKTILIVSIPDSMA